VDINDFYPGAVSPKIASESCICMDAGFAINLSVQNVIKNMRMVKDGVPLVF